MSWPSDRWAGSLRQRVRSKASSVSRIAAASSAELGVKTRPLSRVVATGAAWTDSATGGAPPVSFRLLGEAQAVVSTARLNAINKTEARTRPIEFSSKVRVGWARRSVYYQVHGSQEQCPRPHEAVRDLRSTMRLNAVIHRRCKILGIQRTDGWCRNWISLGRSNDPCTIRICAPILAARSD